MVIVAGDHVATPRREVHIVAPLNLVGAAEGLDALGENVTTRTSEIRNGGPFHSTLLVIAGLVEFLNLDGGLAHANDDGEGGDAGFITGSTDEDVTDLGERRKLQLFRSGEDLSGRVHANHDDDYL